MNALLLSAQIACVVTALSLLIGVPAALALDKGSFRGREALQGFFLAPLLLPTLIIGLALLLFFTPLRLTATLPGLVLGHMTVTAALRHPDDDDGLLDLAGRYRGGGRDARRDALAGGAAGHPAAGRARPDRLRRRCPSCCPSTRP